MDNPAALCLGVAVLLLIVIFVVANNRTQRLRQAEAAYRKSLQQLRQAPDSSKQREATLAAGREYARAARDSRRETLFDEIALMNDINAIAGQQVAKKSVDPSPAPQTTPSVEERLARLRRLAEAGELTEEEYDERRKRLLDEL